MRPSRNPNILSPIVALGSFDTVRKFLIPSNIPNAACITRAAIQPTTGIPASVPANAPLIPILATILPPIPLKKPFIFLQEM